LRTCYSFCQFLFGSKLQIESLIPFFFFDTAKGTATEESDIDIVVVSEDFKLENIFKRADMTKDAEIRKIRKFMAPSILLP
jgi:predicted nucleotidyltransferase